MRKYLAPFPPPPPRSQTTAISMQVLLPGDLIPVPSTSTSLHLGPGLSSSSSSQRTPSSSTTRTPQEVTSTRAGLLGSIPSSTSHRFWIESTLHRYTPSPPEPVLGIITARHAEGYRVDIGTSQSASLDGLAFEGATKRNKPNLKVSKLPTHFPFLSFHLDFALTFVRFNFQIGTLVYGYLLPTPGFSEPELSCVDQTTQKANGFGELSGGYLIRNVELNRCRSYVILYLSLSLSLVR